MTNEEIVEAIKDRVARLNVVLADAFDAQLRVDITTITTHELGKREPRVSVQSRVYRVIDY